LAEEGRDLKNDDRRSADPSREKRDLIVRKASFRPRGFFEEVFLLPPGPGEKEKNSTSKSQQRREEDMGAYYLRNTSALTR